MKNSLENVLALIYLGLLIVLLSLCGLAELRFANFGIDDANIFFTYAKNISNGYGIRWSPNGETVEGFTSPAWLTVCTVIAYLNPKIHSGVFALSATIFFFILSTMHFVLKKYIKSATLTLLLLTGFSFIPGVFNWLCFSLMDTGLWGLYLLLFSLLLVKHLHNKTKNTYISIVLFGCLGILVRPEAFLIVFTSYVFVFGFLAQDKKLGLVAIVALITFQAILAGLRIYYFSYPLPNTYYVKVGFDFFTTLSQGISYISDNFQNYLLLPTLISIGLLLIMTSHREKNEVGQLLLISICIALTLTVVVVLTGGDHFLLARQLIPILPLLFVGVISSLWSQKASFRGATFALILSLLLISFTLSFYRKGLLVKHEYQIAKLGRELGDSLNKQFDSDDPPSVGAVSVGGIGYSYKGEVIDLMGLNNTKMAHATTERKGLKNHAAFDANTFYELAPDLVVDVFSNCGAANEKESYSSFFVTALKGITETQRFKSEYDFFESKNHPNLCGFVSKTYKEDVTQQIPLR